MAALPMPLVATMNFVLLPKSVLLPIPSLVRQLILVLLQAMAVPQTTHAAWKDYVFPQIPAPHYKHAHRTIIYLLTLLSIIVLLILLVATMENVLLQKHVRFLLTLALLLTMVSPTPPKMVAPLPLLAALEATACPPKPAKLPLLAPQLITRPLTLL